MKQALHDFEGFLHADSSYPTLIEVGLAHAQFETIHPFLDGNNLGQNGLLLLSNLFQRPLVNIKLVATLLNSTFPTASRLVSAFEELGLLKETTGQKCSRMFRYEPYLALFADTGG